MAEETGQPEPCQTASRGSCALSASSSWGEHRLAQEVGLFRDVLLHRRNMKEILFFFQWHLFILVITQPYTLLSRPTVVQSFRVLRSLKRNGCLVSSCRPEGKE